jgi:hypothetical protein
MGPEDDSSSPHQWGSAGSLSGTTGPLLPVGLLSPAADFGPSLSRRGPRPVIGLHGGDDLMEYMGINLPVKDLIAQKKIINLFAGKVIDSYRWHTRFLFLSI